MTTTHDDQNTAGPADSGAAVPGSGQQNEGLRVWINGHVYDDAAQAQVSAVDHGLVVGDGVFEAMKVTEAGVFATTRHLDRLARSASALGLPAPDFDTIRSGIDAVVADRSWADGKIRITYTGGRGPLGSGAAFGPALVVVAAEAYDRPASTCEIVTTPWTRNVHGAMTGVKTTSYGENVRALAFADANKAAEGIFINSDGYLCEGTGTNIFLVIGDDVITPPLKAGPLDGITRALLLKWCDEIDERDITLEQAQRADEVFITSSLRDVQGVTRWDDLTFEAPGERTKKIAKVFAERSAADIDPT
ncbi:MAG: aminotransferase class IV [Propionibacteriales bacterium]|nr:aminotransferase class IV [Propionibacteriales bacterium]